MRPWFKNASAYSTSTCPSHSNMHISHFKMPKSPFRAEISIPEAQIFVVERFLRDVSNTPGHGRVCGGGRHQNRVPILFYVCFYGNRPLEPRFSSQKLRCCVERFLRDLFNAPSHASVCAGGRHRNRVPILFYVCFYGNGPLEPRFSTQTLIFCVCRDLGEMCLTYQATWAGVPPPKKSMLE